MSGPDGPPVVSFLFWDLARLGGKTKPQGAENGSRVVAFAPARARRRFPVLTAEARKRIERDTDRINPHQMRRILG
ncbi:hypothetical protein FY133_24580 (plasmid) [Agrobacterium tumefaciens]|uniref:Uncharacterized protein n=1 Tax=Agrobacterium tumefaciens TaxID=358 RepID=A0AAP9E9Q1_AGRTU|nr:hypothetical protein [Agrobacterium tumefaciens]NTZ64180.1 hypothetical protein [Agrobacterium tumefaciens]QDY97615.1 hypothetical protein CG010_025985 [Agrobacterium tumefaciens]UXS50732.1 hypothetical protein FY149_26000 [Agrobacterium tumefaciens]UXS73912.1 hypothetical protein FY146_25485 [Agrobacterium tumefaciens]UXS81577.1 hypothetical protein FY145_25495 [Agrobacterium tumefaciens]